MTALGDCLRGGLTPSLLQCHRGLDRLLAFASRSDRLLERSLEALIGFDECVVVVGRGDSRAQLAPVLAKTAHRLKCSHAFNAVHFVRSCEGLNGGFGF